MIMNDDTTRYAGFWIRVIASLIDSLLIVAIIAPILFYIYGPAYLESTDWAMGPADIVLNWVFPAIAIILFWVYRSATPGKMLLGLTIVDANTGGKPSTAQFVLRYVGYFVATIPLLLGLIWVAFDERKQGWHDKMANTVVIRTRGGGER
jgi:uncharacterized RDD family membrane protein YckC